jgi:RNA polymerase sigma-70 factor (ECF subfamily)
MDLEPAFAAAPVTRSEETWVLDLRSPGPKSDAARASLRALIVVGLRRILASRGVSEDACEDFAQESLLRIEARLDSFRGESRFTTWALSIATRVAFDELRHKRWKDVSFEAITAEGTAPIQFETSAEASPDRALVRARVLAQLRSIIDKDLTEKQRRVLVAELSGMPHEEIATALAMNRNALYKLAHDARRKVKASLQAAGISEREALWAFE